MKGLMKLLLLMLMGAMGWAWVGEAWIGHWF